MLVLAIYQNKLFGEQITKTFENMLRKSEYIPPLNIDEISMQWESQHLNNQFRSLLTNLQWYKLVPCNGQKSMR